MTIVNTQLTAEQNLIALINTSNVATGLALVEGQVTFGAASVIDVNGKNTGVQLTAVSGFNVGTTADIGYNRLALTTGVTNPVTTLVVVEGDTAATLLTKIATQLGLVESELEWDAGTVLPLEGENTVANLLATDGSYLYVGDLMITLDFPAEAEQDLGDAIVVTDLDGFDAVV